MSFEITSDNPVVKAVIEGTAPRTAQLAAARGGLPLHQNDLLEILVCFAAGSDAELKQNAVDTIRAQEEAELRTAASSTQAAPSVLAYFANQVDLPQPVLEAVVNNDRTPPSAIVEFAQKVRNGSLLELVSFNQQLLIQNPEIIEAIIANPSKTAEAERRAIETKREFFQKERGAQQIASELRAQGNEAAA